MADDMTVPQSDQQKSRIAGVFGRAASAYDQVGPRFFAHFGLRLVELSQLHEGAAVLDVGCGRGASLFPVADRIGPTGNAIGIDLAESMIDEMTHDIRARGLANVKAQVMDAEDLRFPAETFDHVLCGFCLFFFPQRERALAEMRRVLRPGGRLAISTWGKFDAQWEWFDELLDSYLQDPESPSKEDDEKLAETETPAGMLAVLGEAGFADAQVVSESAWFTYGTHDEWWATLWSHGVRIDLERIEARLGSRGLAEFKAETRQRMGASMRSGGIRQEMSVLYTLGARP